MIRRITACICFVLLFFGAGTDSYARDIPSYWAESFVDNAIERGFVPEDLRCGWQEPVTRLDFCRLISGLFDAAEGEAFPDCDDEDVITCASLGIVSGFGDGLFYPEKLLTREQAAVILRKAAECLGTDVQVPVYLDPTADSAKTSIWAAEAVWWVMDRGIMAGTGSGRFDPSGSFTKEQSVITIMNLLDPSVSEKTLTRTIETDNDKIKIYESHTGSLSERVYAFDDGTRGVMGRVDGSSQSMVLFTAFVGNDAVVRSTDGSRWEVSSVASGKYYGSVTYVYDKDKAFMFILPQEYRLRENNCLEYLPGKDGYLQVCSVEGGFCLQLVSRAVDPGCVCDYLAIASDSQFFDWKTPGPVLFMKGHGLHGDGRWCWDGYYYICPSTYIPSGENVFYRNTSCYFGKSMAAGLGYYRGCEILSMIIGDTAVCQQNSAGFMPQLNESTWLSGDFNIGTGYYDTRFNSDLAETWMRLYNYDHASNILEPLRKYLDFYLDHAEKRHQETAGGGWFVEDYFNPTGGKHTHTSLNHQLAEASVLYKASAILGDDNLYELADKMILAVENTASKWIKSDNNLHYSISAKGTYGGHDYPYLTYDDLYNMQELLEKIKGSRSDALQSLMDAKLAWMKRNGVHGFKGEGQY